MANYPMLIATAALIAGVLLGMWLHIELWVAATSLIVLLAGALFTQYRSLTLLSVVFLGVLLATAQRGECVEDNHAESRWEQLHHHFHEVATDRLYSLDISTRARAISVATTLGYRRGMEPMVREYYRGSGVQHLLAISGLHLSVVMLLVWCVFAPLALLSHGQVWRSVVMVAALWLFVLSTTMPISVIRSAMMLSVLAISHGAGSRYSSLNTLAVVAFTLILFNVRVIFDIGFLLSFTAVAAIIIYSGLIKSLLRGVRLPLVIRCIVESLLVGVVATLAITPIVSLVFGYISPLSPLVTLPMLPLIYLTITTSLIWIVIPLPLIKGGVECLLEWSASAQIYITSRASEWTLSQIDYSMSGWSVALFYAILVAISLLSLRDNQKK